MSVVAIAPAQIVQVKDVPPMDAEVGHKTSLREPKATYAEIKDYVLKEHGLKVSNLYISQVKENVD